MIIWPPARGHFCVFERGDMSKSDKLICCTILAICLLTFIIIASCGKNGTESGIKFVPGTYAGTYQVQTSAYNPPKVDTMKFMFYGGGGFYMLKDTVFVGADTLYDLDRQFCNVNGEYDIIGANDKLRITIPPDFQYYNICIHEENPSDDYTRSYQDGWIVFSGDDDNYRRKIILWGLMGN